MKDQFAFKQFVIRQDRCAMKVGTDGVLLGAWAANGLSLPFSRPSCSILDIGTGTGLIALMMAQRFPSASVDAIDIDSGAVAQARENVAASPFSARVRVAGCSLQQLAGHPAEGVATWFHRQSFAGYDMIVTNPPFFVNSLKNPDLRRSMARHSDKLPFSDLFRGVKVLLADEGVFAAVIPVDLEEPFSSEAYISGLFVSRRTYVKTVDRKPPKRLLVEYRKSRPEHDEDTTEIMSDSNGIRSEWYAKLTDDFYIR